MCLNDAKKLPIKDDAKFLIVICSTTGNGDAPENADSWWRSIKLRSASKELFLDIPFSVLGLGDTNYDKFCHMGKSIDKRLSELGAKQDIELHCADEATNLEETVESWKKAVIQSLTKYNNDDINNNATTINDDNNLNIENNEEQISSSGLQKNTMSAVEISSWLGVSDKIITAPNASDVPKVKIETSKTIEYVGECAESESHKAESLSPPSSSVDFWNASNPYNAKICGARYLTKNKNISQSESEWEEERKVISMEISLGDSNITYFPGDSIGVCCPNPAHLVTLVFERLKMTDSASSNFTLSSLFKNKKGEIFTVNEILSYKLDLVGLPKKAAVMTLSQFCKDPKESIAMQWLCSKDSIGKKMWSQAIEAQVIGIGELLAMFPSCCPTLSLLLSILSPLPPRYYSISSSPLVRGNRLTIAFSVVRYTCGVTEPSANEPAKTITKIRRLGLCTNYLENLLAPWLNLNQASEILTIKMFHKPTIHFRLPGSVAPPVILIGPGTGVAPFVGFLEHRSQLEKEREKASGETCTGIWRGDFELEEKDLPGEGNSVDEFCLSSTPGPILLYFGCRNDDDFLFKEQLELFLKDNTLSQLSVSMSRVGTEKVYVTHKLLENGKEIADFLLNKGAYIYICGDGNKMAKDVHIALIKLLSEHGCNDDASSQSFLDEMKTRRRYIIDIWS